MESSVDRTIATSPDTEARPSAGAAVWYPSLCSASATRLHPAGAAKAPCTSTTVGFGSAARALVQNADSRSIKAAAMTAPNRSRRRLRSTVRFWVRPFISGSFLAAAGLGGDEVAADRHAISPGWLASPPWPRAGD